MGERVNIHCKTLQSLDWSNNRDGVNDYMVLLVKETVTLHKVLSCNTRPDAPLDREMFIHGVMTPVHNFANAHDYCWPFEGSI